MDMSDVATTIEDLIDDFTLLDDWEERYRHVIELGKGLEPLGEDERTPDTKVDGCVSQVWLVSEATNDTPPRLTFRGDSDAHIVRGLIAILFALYSGRTAREILDTDARVVFEKLGLDQHLSPQRSNGFHAMVARIRADAQKALGTA
jgi:cysteine desulfuration protein SufE